MRQISALFPSTKNIFPAATKSISYHRYQLSRPCPVSVGLSGMASLPFRGSSREAHFPFLPHGFQKKAWPDRSHTLCHHLPHLSGRYSGRRSLPICFLSLLILYIPCTALCYHVQKNIKKTGTSLPSRSLSRTMRYAAVTKRYIPHLMRP